MNGGGWEATIIVEERTLYIPEETENDSLLLKTEDSKQHRDINHTRWMPQASTVMRQPARADPTLQFPAWVGHDAFIYLSIFTIIFCGCIAGMVALVSALEARRKKRQKQNLVDAKSYTIASIACNVFAILLFTTVFSIYIIYVVTFIRCFGTHTHSELEDVWRCMRDSIQ